LYKYFEIDCAGHLNISYQHAIGNTLPWQLNPLAKELPLYSLPLYMI